jgi:hypothetical protein
LRKKKQGKIKSCQNNKKKKTLEMTKRNEQPHKQQDYTRSQKNKSKQKVKIKGAPPKMKRATYE